MAHVQFAKMIQWDWTSGEGKRRGLTSRELGRDRNRSDLGRRTWQKQLHVHCVFPNMFCFYLANDHDLWSLVFQKRRRARLSKRFSPFQVCGRDIENVWQHWCCAYCFIVRWLLSRGDVQVWGWPAAVIWISVLISQSCIVGVCRPIERWGRPNDCHLSRLRQGIWLRGWGTLKRQRIIWHWYWTSFSVGWRFSWLVFNF